MKSVLSRLLRTRRRQLQLTQQELAERVGVRRQALVRWESGQRPVPSRHLAALAEILSVSEEALHELQGVAPKGNCVTLPDVPTRLQPVKCSIGDMVGLGQTAYFLHQHILSRLGGALYDELSQSFLRDTAHELLATHHLLADECCTLDWLSPLEAKCPLLISAEDKRTYTGHYRQLTVRWRGDDEEILLFPQVPLVVVKSGLQYRVDFLVRHTRSRRRACWMAFELDGPVHDYSRGRDRDRTADLQMPVIRFDDEATLRGDFTSLLLHRLRQSAAYARSSDVEYRRFSRRKHTLRSTQKAG